MKKQKRELIDETPPNTPFEGDLAYGRCFGTEPSRNDYPADRDSNGNAKNVVTIPLKLVQPKDEVFWSRVKRPKSKYYDNTILRQTFLSTLARAVVKNQLKYNVEFVTIGHFKARVS